jgi:putative membrane protein
MNGFGDMANMMDNMMGGGWSGFGLAGTLFNVLLLVAFLAAVVWFVARILPAGGENKSPVGRVDPAEETLRERFARGEIDAGEYERTLEVLRGGPGQRTYEDYVREATRRLTGKPSARE